MKNLVRAAFVTLALSAAAEAQCPNVSFSFYGQTCPFFGQPAPLSPNYDDSACVIRFRLARSRTCCNTFAQFQVLFLGVTRIDPGIRHPLLLPDCVLSVWPLVAIAQPASAGGDFFVPVPPITGTVFAQGINDYFTTIGMTHEFQSSDAVQVDIR